MDSKFLLAEVQACCSSLGYLDNGAYHRGEDHLNAVKDLIRYLRRDGEVCQIRRILGEARVLQNDLVPMLKQYKDDEILFDFLVRLIVNLTQPAALCFNNKPPEDKELRMYYLQITSHLQSYKQFFANETAFFTVVTKKLVGLFNREWEEREEEERLLVERLLVLVRNIVSIPSDPESERRTDNDVSVHDLLYWAMQSAGLESVFLYISSTSSEAQFCLHTLEIINHVLREQSPSELASAGQTRTEKEQENDSQELEAIRLREAAVKKMNALKFSGRHSQFGGTFTLANVKGIADADAIVHKSLNKIKEKISFDDDKKRRRRPKNKLAVADRDAVRKSTQTIRVVLRDFCVKFLEHCYNPAMRAVRDAIRHKKGEENDETFFFWAMRFFMEFNRLYNFDVGLISETLSMQTFHLIQVHLTDCYERMIMAKRQVQESLSWGRRLHLAFKAYQELLLTVHAMGKSKDTVLINNSTILKNNLFYVTEYRDLFVMLLKKFDDSRLSKSFLRDLFETAHVFIKMLEDHCKGNAHTMVQKTKVVKKKKKRKPNKSVHSTLTPEELDAKWSSLAPRLSQFLCGAAEIPDDVIPFDAASSVGIEDQKAQAMIRIQETLRDDHTGEAVALLRAARSVWAEGDVFGAEQISPEDELDALRQVMMADLPRFDRGGNHDNDDGGGEDDEEEREEEGDEEEEIAQQMVPVEVEFKFEEYMTKFGRGEIIKNCCLLLKEYDKNTTSVNHAVVKMLHRLCVDMKLGGLTHHVAMLRVFQKVLHDPGAKAKNVIELYGFAKFMTRKFFEDLGRNPLLVVEALFWKDLKEAIDVTEGYGSFKEKSKAAKILWTEDQENEIKLLWEEHRHRREAGEDVADVILDALSDPGEKTRTQLVRQMVRMGLLGSARDLKVRGKPREPKTPKNVWPEELSEELTALFQRHRETAEEGEEGEDGRNGGESAEGEKLDVLDKIMRDLSDSSRSRKDILMRLTQMDLIQDPNAYRKKGNRHIAYWREEQVEQLKELWQRYENAQSPLNMIKAGISANRSKSSIADKLLEMGLIPNKKELMSKKAAGEGGGRKKKDQWANRTDEEDVVTPPTTDDENGGGKKKAPVDAASLSKGLKKEKKKSRKSKSSRDLARSRREDRNAKAGGNVKTIVKDLQERGLEEPVKWLRGMMRMQADDLKDGGDDDEDETNGGFALVPLTEENEEAISDAGFLRLLRALGFSEPVVGQEAFWRIPSSIDHESLFKLASDIDAGLRMTIDDEVVDGKEDAATTNSIATSNVDSSGSSSGSGSGSSSGSSSGDSSDSGSRSRSSSAKPPRSVRSTSSLSSRAASRAAKSQNEDRDKDNKDSDDEDDLDNFLTTTKTKSPTDAAAAEAVNVDDDDDNANEKSDRWKMLRVMAKTRCAENKRGVGKSNGQRRQRRKLNKEQITMESQQQQRDNIAASDAASESRAPSNNADIVTTNADDDGRGSATPSDATPSDAVGTSATPTPGESSQEDGGSGDVANSSQIGRVKGRQRVVEAETFDDDDVSPAIDETFKRKRRVLTDSDDDDDDDDDVAKPLNDARRKKARVTIDDDDDDGDESGEEKESEEKRELSPSSAPPTKRRAVIDSDSD